MLHLENQVKKKRILIENLYSLLIITLIIINSSIAVQDFTGWNSPSHLILSQNNSVKLIWII